jgi:hypothetical protein
MWQSTVRDEAAKHWPVGQQPLSVPLQITVVYYHDSPSARIDNDNLVKPIQDALNGLVYRDDNLITDVIVRKTDLNGLFQVKGMASVVAEGFVRGEEFLYVRIEDAPDHTRLL